MVFFSRNLSAPANRFFVANFGIQNTHPNLCLPDSYFVFSPNFIKINFPHFFFVLPKSDGEKTKDALLLLLLLPRSRALGNLNLRRL